jgi:hypothetical protein
VQTISGFMGLKALDFPETAVFWEKHFRMPENTSLMVNKLSVKCF